MVSAPSVQALAETHVREEVSALLSRLGRRYAMVACVSGRPVAEARRLVGVRSAEGPDAIVTRADLVVDGAPGFTDVLVALAESG